MSILIKEVSMFSTSLQTREPPNSAFGVPPCTTPFQKRNQPAFSDHFQARMRWCGPCPCPRPVNTATDRTAMDRMRRRSDLTWGWRGWMAIWLYFLILPLYYLMSKIVYIYILNSSWNCYNILLQYSIVSYNIYCFITSDIIHCYFHGNILTNQFILFQAGCRRFAGLWSWSWDPHWGFLRWPLLWYGGIVKL